MQVPVALLPSVDVPAEALPFAASALLAILGVLSSYIVGKRVPGVVRELNEPYRPAEGKEKRRIPPHLSPDGVGTISVWATDTAQSGVALVGPPVAALALVEGKTGLLNLAYIAVAIVGVGVFARLLHLKPDRYAERSKFGMTLVGALAIAINLVLAVVVGFTAG